MSPDVPLTLCGRADRPESFLKQKCKSFRTKSSARHESGVDDPVPVSITGSVRDRSGGYCGKASVVGYAHVENGFNSAEKRTGAAEAKLAIRIRACAWRTSMLD